ncbi:MULTISPECIES: DUF2892 domain-containing protein [Pseudoalteromonas]|nr:MULTISPECIES: DUF2892 domain-containing protein [Pseudoalteromonas]ATD08152.1 hypothetical protein PPIS_a3345 [Pseudoalteromonas piscicida]MCO7201514.1 DUF2892 domain-containing protein [Pseudoalteromonas sp. OANN1]WPU30210.1 DUF2892 domain-containing protein [Pseudoalteromonas piscicida]
MFAISLLLTHFVSPHWVWFSVFICVNLVQSAFTNWCPMIVILKKLGIQER